ncbi:hypothetical protein SAMN05216327_102147 [Dyadobacter sp. SG02]|nr:hypothetical protein SAMN05216327_102147 [Dyadobacter sp. SG02]
MFKLLNGECRADVHTHPFARSQFLECVGGIKQQSDKGGDTTCPEAEENQVGTSR